MFEGKMKALTFSYDDGVTQDIRLIKLFDKYNMKATFNINGGRLGEEKRLFRNNVWFDYNRIRTEDVRYVYENHEVAVHTLTHPNLRLVEDDKEVIRQVEEDRLILSELCSYEVVGMAYPCGGNCFDERVIDLIRNNTGIKYARTTNSTYNFALQTELLAFNPSVHHPEKQMEKLFELGERFMAMKADTPQIFYIWGHSHEFDMNNDWEKFEAFLEMMSGRDDICYCTNRQAFHM